MSDDPELPLTDRERWDNLHTAYAEDRRRWARLIGNPYPEDGGKAAGRGRE